MVVLLLPRSSSRQISSFLHSLPYQRCKGKAGRYVDQSILRVGWSRLLTFHRLLRNMKSLRRSSVRSCPGKSSKASPGIPKRVAARVRMRVQAAACFKTAMSNACSASPLCTGGVDCTILVEALFVLPLTLAVITKDACKSSVRVPQRQHSRQLRAEKVRSACLLTSSPACALLGVTTAFKIRITLGSRRFAQWSGCYSLLSLLASLHGWLLQYEHSTHHS